MIKHKRVSSITEYLRDSEKELLEEVGVEEKEGMEKRKWCYLKIAEHIWNAEGKALQDGNFELYEKLAETYENWLSICLREGVM